MATNKPECPYCGATEGLRMVHDGGGFVEPEYTCEADKEQKAQGARCGCKGVDDMCVCQNVTDATTRAERAQFGRR